MTTDDITSRIKEILKDKRLSYPTANLFANAPLALIQLQMEVELHTLQKVLQIKPTNIKELRGEND